MTIQESLVQFNRGINVQQREWQQNYKYMFCQTEQWKIRTMFYK